MIRSMTGFGRGKYENDGRTYIVEIKSVNHKYSDISIKMPKIFNEFETQIRKSISNNISRGKIDVFIIFEDYGNKSSIIHFNTELAKEYMSGLKKLSEVTGAKFEPNIIDISKFPDVLKIEENDNEDIISKEIMLAVNEAIEKFIQMREIEGTRLIDDISERINFVENKVLEIEKYSSTVVEDYMKRLKVRVSELMKDKPVDENRLAQEIVIFSDKCSIEEELTRLKSHILQFRNFINSNESPIGKKFDFLIQEINREVNTIASKANCIEITNRVIELKTEIENIREQIQNIE